MKNKISFAAILIIAAASFMFSQSENNQTIVSVNFITCKIEFVDSVVTGYSPIISKVYPAKLQEILSPHYLCKFTIKWNGGENAYTDDPFIVICYLPDKTFRKITLNEERYTMMTDKFYDFSFDIYSDKKITGWTTLELGKYNYNEDDNYVYENNIRYDKTTFYTK